MKTKRKIIHWAPLFAFVCEQNFHLPFCSIQVVHIIWFSNSFLLAFWFLIIYLIDGELLCRWQYYAYVLCLRWYIWVSLFPLFFLKIQNAHALFLLENEKQQQKRMLSFLFGERRREISGSTTQNFFDEYDGIELCWCATQYYPSCGTKNKNWAIFLQLNAVVVVVVVVALFF